MAVKKNVNHLRDEVAVFILMGFYAVQEWKKHMPEEQTLIMPLGSGGSHVDSPVPDESGKNCEHDRSRIRQTT